MREAEALKALGLNARERGTFSNQWHETSGREWLETVNPATGQPIASVSLASLGDFDQVVKAASAAFLKWRSVPAPARGEVVRLIGNALREKKTALGRLLTFETGKIRSEAEGEVQEMIDMCDFAVGLSRQLYGLTIASERPKHRMFEQWHPLGPVGIITAFNFPVAVWAWNAMIAAVCGDTTIWKPSPEAPLLAVAVQHIVNEVVAGQGVPPGVFCLCVGATETVGEALIADERVPLISATGSCRMGHRVASVVGARLGRALLELGGNNAVIVTPTADLELTLRAVLFAAVGTAGQRCTTLRRLIIHESIADAFVARLKAAYASVTIGDPADERVLMGPLINRRAVESYKAALAAAVEQGGAVVYGGSALERPGNFVEPALVRATREMAIVREETFAPILYVLTYRDFADAIALQNGVTQGLSSAVFTDRVGEAELFLSAEGSDCGIANVNIGTSGAEIGGAFGGEKQTGGGREAGSDSWKAYMRRQTCTVNYSGALPLAQGVRFEIGPS